MEKKNYEDEFTGEIPEVLGPEIDEEVTRKPGLPHYGKRITRKISIEKENTELSDQTILFSFLILIFIYIIIVYLFVWYIRRNNSPKFNPKNKLTQNVGNSDLIIYILVGILIVGYSYYLYCWTRNKYKILGMMLFSLSLLILGIIIRSSDIRIGIYRIYMAFSLVLVFLLEIFWMKSLNSNFIYTIFMLVVLIR